MAPRRRTRTGYRLELVEVDSPRIDRDAGGAEAGVTAGRGRQETGRGEDGVCASQDQGFQDSDFPPLHGQAFLTEDVRTPDTHDERPEHQKDGRRQPGEVMHVQDVGADLAQQTRQGGGRSENPWSTELRVVQKRGGDFGRRGVIDDPTAVEKALVSALDNEPRTALAVG